MTKKDAPTRENQPDSTQSSIRPSARPTIGYTTPDLDRYFTAMWAGALEVAQKQDANLICFLCGMLPGRVDFKYQANVLLDLVSPENVDGLIFNRVNVAGFLSTEETRKFIERFRPLPITSIGLVEGTPSIVVENESGMRELVSHLIEVHGYRRIALIRGHEGHPEAEARYNAYAQTLAEHNIPLDPNLVTPPYVWMEDWKRSSVEAIRCLLDERKLRPKEDVEVIIGNNDTSAVSAMELLRERGIQVPQDVAVVGFDDHEIAQFVTPSLSTVHQPIAGKARWAAETLLAQLEGKPVPEQVSVPTTMVIRQSCGCLDQTVAQAAVEPMVVSGKGAEASFAARPRREDILSAMISVAGATADQIPGRVEQLLDAFIAEIKGESLGAFLATLEGLLREATATGGDAAAWQGAISALRRHVLASLANDNEALFRAENLWQQARLTIGEIARRAQAYRRLEMEQQTRILYDISQELVTALDVAGLMDVLARVLPQLGIPACYLSLYEDPNSPADWSRLMLAYDERGRVDLEPGGRRFPSRQLVPDGLLPQGRRYIMVVESLYFRETQFGFVLFEAGPRGSMVYDSLRAQISGVLQEILLVRRVQERSAELARQQYILDTFMENVPDRIYFKDRDSRFTRVNKAHAIHVGLADPAEELGKSDFDFFPEDQAQSKFEQEQVIIRSEQPILNFEEPDGVGRWALTTKMPLRDEHGAVIGTFGISRDITDLKRTQAALEKAYAEVEEQVKERTAELQQEIAVRRRAEEQVRQLNVELEQRVVERTAQLRAANKELEAFSYTVSHDLRAPLRAIDGYTRILVEDYEPLLDAEGKRVCGVITDSTQRMGQLIDDLLALSRLSRTDMQSTPIDMKALAEAAFDHLTTPESRARIDFRLGALPPALGDPTLIGQVWGNLLSNALKFSSKRERAVIEVGCQESAGESIYYVRDNGSGFDMQYAGKLFGMFQRLHSERDFEGTGLGLAIVQRVISRHGGRVWGEGAVDGGATFYFTLQGAK
jgi:PAS domain S-box-containing protein